MNGPPKDGMPSPYYGEYSPDFFDFIVIDECPRSGASDESNPLKIGKDPNCYVWR